MLYTPRQVGLPPAKNTTPMVPAHHLHVVQFCTVVFIYM